MKAQPTDIPRGDRRTIRVILHSRLTAPAPSTVEGVLLAAARIIARNGLWRDDYVEDALNHDGTDTPMYVRPMSVIGAIRCASTGHPQYTSQIADTAVGFLALSLGGGPARKDMFSLEQHVDRWAEGSTAAHVVAVLELTATTPECAA